MSMLFYSEPTLDNFEEFKKSIELAVENGYMNHAKARVIIKKAEEFLNSNEKFR